MLAITLLLVQLYLATVLGVSGLAKAIDPGQFAATLRRQRILPGWSIKITSRVVPWLEMMLAIVLVLEIFAVPTNALTLAIFACFFAIEAILVKTKRSKECGCYGVAYRRQVDGASLIVSALFVGLAGFGLWGALTLEPVGSVWRTFAVFVFGLCSLWLISKTLYKQLQLRKYKLHRKSQPVSVIFNTPRPDNPPLV